ncbi:MAG: hypothetical protein HKN45_01190 [Flavobacteriales bacterium]|nr:hypothetical protein [Flavobacteriales bacterium]
MGLVYRPGMDKAKVEGLKPLSNSERQRIKELASKYYRRESGLNKLKYRNLQRIHAGLVNDIRAEETMKSGVLDVKEQPK